MNPPPVVPGPQRGRNVRTVVLVVLAVIVSVPLLAWAIFRETGRRRVEAEIAAIRRAGEPVTWEELNRWYVEPPPGQNAAGIYTQAFAKLVVPDPVPANLPLFGCDAGKLPELGEPLPVEMKAAITDCLETNAVALEILHLAANYHDCRYPVDLSRGFAASLPDLTKLRFAAKVLELEAILSAEERRADQAQSALVTGWTVGSSLRQEPILISRLVTISINGLMVSGLEQSINRVAFTDAQLAEFMAALAVAEREPGMVRALTGERAQGGGFFDGIRTGKVPPRVLFGLVGPKADATARLYRVSGLAEREEVYYLGVLNDYIAATRRPLGERLPAAKAVARRTKNCPRIFFISSMLLPALEKAIEKDVEGIVNLEVARTALAVQRFRLAQGKLPAVLGDLVPVYLDAVPVDPFDGQQLRFKPLAAGFVVYSVGRDGEDNDGRAKNAEGRQFQPGTDITFTVVR